MEAAKAFLAARLVENKRSVPPTELETSAQLLVELLSKWDELDLPKLLEAQAQAQDSPPPPKGAMDLVRSMEPEIDDATKLRTKARAVDEWTQVLVNRAPMTAAGELASAVEAAAAARYPDAPEALHKQAGEQVVDYMRRVVEVAVQIAREKGHTDIRMLDMFCADRKVRLEHAVGGLMGTSAKPGP